MKYIDFTVQSLLVGLTAGIVIAGIFDPQWLEFFMLLQFFVGVWQMASCFFSLLAGAGKAKAWHMGISSLYLILLVVLFNIYRNPLFIDIFMIGPSWILALYYYGLTWRLVFPRYKNHSNFLPHINF